MARDVRVSVQAKLGSKLSACKYKTTDEFFADMRLVFDNSIKYCRALGMQEDEGVFKYALLLKKVRYHRNRAHATRPVLPPCVGGSSILERLFVVAHRLLLCCAPRVCVAGAQKLEGFIAQAPADIQQETDLPRKLLAQLRTREKPTFVHRAPTPVPPALHPPHVHARLLTLHHPTRVRPATAAVAEGRRQAGCCLRAAPLRRPLAALPV